MKLSWLDSSDSSAAPCTSEDLAAVGVFHQRFSTDAAVYEPEIAALSRTRGYVARDEVALAPETPNLAGLLSKFADEHLHTEDEVRFVLAGEGIFDIRSRDDRWMRVVVSPGDLLIVPANCHHRFSLTDASQIRCVRLFRDASGWTPIYRTAT